MISQVGIWPGQEIIVLYEKVPRTHLLRPEGLQYKSARVLCVSAETTFQPSIEQAAFPQSITEIICSMKIKAF